MVDRLPQYPMYSQSVMQNSVQQPTQPQMPQQPQQPQQSEPQMMQGLPNTDVRMWQMQMQNSYRAQQPGDLAPPQLNQQEYPRSQTFPQGQGQQPMVQQLQQPFGLHSQRISAPGTPFHDYQGNQPQSHIPPAFAMNTPSMKPGPNRMMQPGMNPVLARQLQMMGSQNAANQQAPNPMDLPRSLSAQHGAKQPANGEMFAMPSNPDQMHGSPRLTPQQMGPPAAGQGPAQNGQRRLPTLAELSQKRQHILSGIAHLEQQMAQFQATARTGGVSEPAYQQQLNVMRTELNSLNSRKEYINRLSATLTQIANHQQMANGTMPHMNSIGVSSSQPHPLGTGSTPPSQPGFVAQTNSNSNSPHVFGPPGNGHSPNNAHTPAPANQLPVQPGQMGRQNGPPNRPAPVAHQLPGQVANAMSPNMANGNQFALQSTNGQSAANQQRVNLMPLEKQRFESTYIQYCRSQRMDPTMQVPIADKLIDLHQLHVEVMHDGGHTSVTQGDTWAVIAARLGFVQFPGDPPRSGPVIAQQVQQTYYKYLQQFESAYVMTVINRPANNQQQMGGLLSGGGGPRPPPAGQPAEAQPNATRVNANILPTLIHIAHLSVADMRAKNVPENLITIVETYRPDILKWRHEMMLRRAANEQSGMSNSQGQPSIIPEQVGLGGSAGAQRQPQAMIPNQPSIPTSEQRQVSGLFAPGASQPNIRSPRPEELRSAFTAISNWKAMFDNRSVASMAPQPVPDEQRLHYNELLEQVHKLTSDLEPKLPMYLAFLNNEDMIRKCVATVSTVAKQRQLLSNSSPQYIVTFPTLRNMFAQIQKANEEFEHRHRIIKAMQFNAPPGSVNRPNPGPPPTAVGQQHPLHLAPPAINRQIPHNPPPQPQPPQQHPTPQPQPPPKKPAQTSVPPSPSNPPATTAVATPPAAALTPAASAATPQTTAGSPQTPKSPKSKVAARPKVPPRVKKPASSAKGPSTPEAAPAFISGVKRPPEDDNAALTATVASSEAVAGRAPSPKKVKTEWEGEPSEALVKKRQEVENIKTEEDAMAFFTQVITLVSQDNAIQSDIAASLDLILAGVAQAPEDAAATAAAISARVSGDAGPSLTALSPYQPPIGEEFIDFSTYTTLEDEEESKPPTPDLVPSAEANPSPESGSDADLSGGSPDKSKVEDSTDQSSFVRLGKEIDSGESAYYQSDGWQWTGEMYPLDWAMSTSS